MYKYKHASACQSHAPQCRILNSRYSKRGAPRLGPARTNGTASRGPCSSTSKAGLPWRAAGKKPWSHSWVSNYPRGEFLTCDVTFPRTVYRPIRSQYLKILHVNITHAPVVLVQCYAASEREMDWEEASSSTVGGVSSVRSSSACTTTTTTTSSTSDTAAFKATQVVSKRVS